MIKEKLDKTIREAILWLTIFILVISLAGCQGTGQQLSDHKVNQPNNSFPLTVTDDMGRKINLKTEPQRIVSLAPSNTEILFFLGLGDRVVGDTTYCDFPEQAKAITKIGGFKDPNLEKIVSLKPDLVLATDMHKDLVAGLESARVNVIVLNPNTIEEIFDDIQLVGRAAGIEDKAIDLIRNLENRVDAINQKIARVSEHERPTVYYEMWYEPLMSVGGNTLIGQVIELAGGINITDDSDEEYPEISEEIIIERNPQVMINSYGHAAKQTAPEEIMARKGWSEISFVKNNRIYTIDSDLLTIASPRIIDGIEMLAEYLYPQLK